MVNKIKDLSSINNIYISLHSSIFIDKFMEDIIYEKLLFQLKKNHFADINLSPVYNKYILTWEEANNIFFTGNNLFIDGSDIKKRVEQAFTVFKNLVYYNAKTNNVNISKNGLCQAYLTNLEIFDYKNLDLNLWKSYFANLNILELCCKDFEKELIGVHTHIEVVMMKSISQQIVNKKNFICIAYDGSVMPSPFLCPDNPEHRNYILGNIMNDDLLDIYNSEKAIQFREKL